MKTCLLSTALVSAAVLIGGRPVYGACNIIPPATPTFRSTLASLDRPFARPGDWVKISVDPVCHSAASGFGGVADPVVTVVFSPPARPTTAVVLLSDCLVFDAR